MTLTPLTLEWLLQFQQATSPLPKHGTTGRLRLSRSCIHPEQDLPISTWEGKTNVFNQHTSVV